MKDFVLKPNGNDAYAEASREALLAYAKHIRSENAALAVDLIKWVRRERRNGIKPWRDPKTGLEWSVDANYFEKPMSWEAAVKACKFLGNGWRLPTIQELVSLIDYTQHDPAPPKGHPFNNVMSYQTQSSYSYYYYWSATTYAYNTEKLQSYYMDRGYVNRSYKTYNYYVWPVRDAREDDTD